ncbi:hypothetical protein RRG08_034405 [Elysia crispata]|uniref:Uncharacterized protein n=1 Tax=Elysia crispata TaxID=231223 RepID=A0AAE1CWQ6_9GAST|nr:hypothetical protein RRG08_034405 [Elysia crispata]
MRHSTLSKRGSQVDGVNAECLEDIVSFASPKNPFYITRRLDLLSSRRWQRAFGSLFKAQRRQEETRSCCWHLNLPSSQVQPLVLYLLARVAKTLSLPVTMLKFVMMLAMLLCLVAMIVAQGNVGKMMGNRMGMPAPMFPSFYNPWNAWILYRVFD